MLPSALMYLPFLYCLFIQRHRFLLTAVLYPQRSHVFTLLVLLFLCTQRYRFMYFPFMYPLETQIVDLGR